MVVITLYLGRGNSNVSTFKYTTQSHVRTCLINGCGQTCPGPIHELVIILYTIIFCILYFLLCHIFFFFVLLVSHSIVTHVSHLSHRYTKHCYTFLTKNLGFHFNFHHIFFLSPLYYFPFSFFTRSSRTQVFKFNLFFFLYSHYSTYV